MQEEIIDRAQHDGIVGLLPPDENESEPIYEPRAVTLFNAHALCGSQLGGGGLGASDNRPMVYLARQDWLDRHTRYEWERALAEEVWQALDERDLTIQKARLEAEK